MLGLGLVFFGLGLYLSHTLTADWSYWEFFLPQAVRGISLMFIFIPVNALALGTLPPHLLKGGAGPVQPDAQSGRGHRAGGDQHPADQPP